MNKIILTLLIVSLSLSLSIAQGYKVIHVNGNIIAKSTNKSLARGTDFIEKEQFQYKTNNARAVVINTSPGKRYILKGATGSAFAKANLAPPMNHISSRGGALNNRLDLKNHFQGEYVILNKLKIQINSQVFPMDKDHFFFISYLYKGGNVNKRLQFKDDLLIIEKDSLLRVDGLPILNKNITDMSLYYFSKNSEKATKSLISSSFYPVFPDNKSFKEEIGIIVSTLKNKEKENIITEITNYIFDAYGKPNKENVKQWYNEYYK